MAECYVRGNTIKYLRVADEVLQKVEEESARRQGALMMIAMCTFSPRYTMLERVSFEVERDQRVSSDERMHHFVVYHLDPKRCRAKAPIRWWATWTGEGRTRSRRRGTTRRGPRRQRPRRSPGITSTTGQTQVVHWLLFLWFFFINSYKTDNNRPLPCVSK